jgi:hypothetical protein
MHFSTSCSMNIQIQKLTEKSLPPCGNTGRGKNPGADK